MRSELIYKRDVSGNIRIWYWEVGDGPLEGHWRTVSGLINGEQSVSEWKYATPKSQFNAQEQAIFEATSAMTKKLKVDYRETIETVDENRDSFIKPMLAHKYEGWQGLCFVQPKIDGMRCIANVDGLWSRLNRPIISMPHIEAILMNFFEDYPNIVIDGELYNHNLYDNFNAIMSLTKKTKPTYEDLDRSERLIEYWIFDMVDLDRPDLKFCNRWDFITQNLNLGGPIVLTPTTMVPTEESLDLNFIQLLQDGFEGQIIRKNKEYQWKRSYHLLKRKEYIDEEFELVDIIEGQGNWAGYAKIASCVMPDGREFGAGISGTQEFNKQLLFDKDKYRSVTVKYFQLTPDGVPRFPIAIKFHEEVFEDLKERIKPKKDLFGEY
jgi:DNA ligase 1